MRVEGMRTLKKREDRSEGREHLKSGNIEMRNGIREVGIRTLKKRD